jgi:hypothetical protein
MKKKDYLDIQWQDAEIRQSNNVDKLVEDAKNKKEKEKNFNAY